MGSKLTEPKAAEVLSMPSQASGLLDRIVEQQAQVASRYKPVMSIEESIERYKQLTWYFENVMIAGVDYVQIPGVDKPFLSKSGAQGLCAFFGYVPRYEVMAEIEDWTGDDHNGEPLFYFKFRCTLERDRQPVGEGIGSANSWEAKYRYRVSERSCPECGTESIIKGKAEYGGGWLCYKKKGGCGAKFEADDERIAEQETGRKPNDQFADVINTCQKQGEKRAYVEATLSATGASRFFGQDEDVIPELPNTKPAGDPLNAPKPKAETKTAAKPKDRPTPEAFAQTFKDMRKDLSVATAAYGRLERMFIQRAGDAGLRVYDGIAAAFNDKYPQGTSDYSAHKDFILDLWDALQAVEPEAPPQADVAQEMK